MPRPVRKEDAMVRKTTALIEARERATITALDAWYPRMVP